MSDRLFTTVELVFYPEFRNDRLRFGRPVGRVDLDRRRALAVFDPGEMFGYVRWYANEYGTQSWSFLVAQTLGQLDRQGVALTRVDGIKPGAGILLHLDGAARVRQLFKLLDALEARGFEAEDISPSYYRHLHNRILTRSEIRPYSNTQHRAVQTARLVLE
ncbi:hypothetical protein B0E33_18985 [Roseibium algicola]|uniref:DUF2840 domain-containing protein n=1 Tax=Roseibium algicola TaxID=2857014 RepID=A0ABM6I4T4_9HYPH|nr:DUF2840 domain-containing protein [Roseibium aggregatum]AQQ05399.1 hypothetical protein B0E33_18985 [Roseibium aggregatum]